MPESLSQSISPLSQPPVQDLATQDFSSNGLLIDFNMIEKMNDLAKLMATSRVAVPKHFQGSPGDCLAVVMQSAQWGMNPFAVAQKCFAINGVLGYEAQLVSAVINTKAPISTRLQYEWFGPWEKVVGNVRDVPSKKTPGETYRKLNTTAEDEKGCGVRVWATLKGEQAPRTLELLLLQAGVRNSTLWADDPKQQLAYLATKRWARLYCPEVILGVYTPDELDRPAERDMGNAVIVEDSPKPGGSSRTEAIKSRFKGAKPNTTTLEAVLRQIEAAKNRDDLSKAAEMAVLLTSTEEQNTASIAFAKKKEELKRSAIAPVPETEDSAPVQEQPLPGLSFDKIQTKLQQAEDVDLLDAAADLIAELDDPKQREALSTLYRLRRDEMTQ